MSQTTLAESLLLNRGEYLGQTVLLLGDLSIERDRACGCILLPASAKRRGTQQLQGALPDSDPEV